MINMNGIRIITRARAGVGSLNRCCGNAAPIRWASNSAAAAAMTEKEGSSSSSPAASSSSASRMSRKKKKPSATEIYMKDRSDAFQKHDKAAQQANLPWRIVAAG